MIAANNDIDFHNDNDDDNYDDPLLLHNRRQSDDETQTTTDNTLTEVAATASSDDVINNNNNNNNNGSGDDVNITSTTATTNSTNSTMSRHRNLQPLRRNRSRIRLDATATITSRRSFDNGELLQQQQQQLQQQQQQQQNPGQINEDNDNIDNNNNNIPTTQTNNNNNQQQQQQQRRTTSTTTTMRYKSSYVYILISSIIAFFAIISPPSKRNLQNREYHMNHMIPNTSSSSSSSTTSSSSTKSQSHPINQINDVIASASSSTTAKKSPKTATSTTGTSYTISNSLDNFVSKYYSYTSSNSNKDVQGVVGKGGVEHAFVSVEQVARAAATGVLSDLSPKEKPRLLKYASTTANDDNNNNKNVYSNVDERKNDSLSSPTTTTSSSGIFSFFHFWGRKNKIEKEVVKEAITTTTKTSVQINNDDIKNNDNGNNDGPPILKWFMPRRRNNNDNTNNNTIVNNNENKKKNTTSNISKDEKQLDSSTKARTATHSTSSSSSSQQNNNIMKRILYKIIDPSLFEWVQDSKAANNVFDKIIHSTPRIVAIANFLLAGTYLLHSAVADLFLGEAAYATVAAVGNVGGAGTATVAGAGTAAAGQPAAAAAMVGLGGVGASPSTVNRMHRSGRERLGGYLLFKLLLISAVVEPDTLDLLILLSWYTLLSFLKSLSFLAGLTTAHATAAGQMPHKGVFRLLIIILICDITAAATCTALFHHAGWSIVILLTCDCALLAIDVLTHLARFFQQVIDEKHQALIAELEARQIRLHEINRSRTGNSFNDDNDDSDELNDEEEEYEPDEVQMLSRQLDHEMELHEATNSKRLELLDNTAFVLEICALIITTGHFVHIWSLHGVTFNLVDGVLALHLHSAISAIGKKIAERRNHYRIVRDLDNYFEDVSEIELKKACAAGDVCCICLGTMSMGNVKKIGCGHIYHTNCLREVVERARSIEAARCPLCRQSIVDGSHLPSQPHGMPQPFLFSGFTANNRETPAAVVPPRDNPLPRANNTQQEDNNQNNRNANGQEGENAFAGNAAQNQSERALFRFSTEGILPAWLPLPAFSFEVVRRPPLGTDNGGDNVVPTQMQPQQNAANNNAQNRDQQNQQEGQQPFWRRLLILAGAIPMSPEEEAAAVTQLVDMFPQYERADLLRELRERGSAEAVVDSVLAGLFTGVDRGGALGAENDNIQVQEEEEVENEQEIIERVR